MRFPVLLSASEAFDIRLFLQPLLDAGKVLLTRLPGDICIVHGRIGFGQGFLRSGYTTLLYQPRATVGLAEVAIHGLILSLWHGEHTAQQCRWVDPIGTTHSFVYLPV